MQLRFIPDARPISERLGPEFFRALPASPGVYLMRDSNQAVVYVGKAKNLKKRLGSYRVANADRLPRRILRLLNSVESISIETCLTEADALAREAELLLSLKPKFNRAGIWPKKEQFLALQFDSEGLTSCLTFEPVAGFINFGPYFKGVVGVHKSICRLGFVMLNDNVTSFSQMPVGWFSYPFPNRIYIRSSRNKSCQYYVRIQGALSGDTSGLIDWSKPIALTRLTQLFDRQVLDEILESLDHSLSVLNP